MKISINDKEYGFSRGESILEIARREDIYIPTLCTHHELPSFGACRMCLVEVEKARGYLPACTTPAQDGMVVQTKTEGIQSTRRGILELILSEHTSACIVCRDKEECREFRGGPIKMGRVTGCRFCPENQHCELIEVADYVGLEDIRFPLEYKDFPQRRDDPFIERDPNLCILCGRCVRVCAQIRGREAISFLHRGHRAEVGTSFDKPLLDVGCMFCGACVDVCPTGSLSSKSTKWHGDPEEKTSSVCLLCGANCQLEFQGRWDSLMAAVPLEEGRNHGQACVRGRFCLPPLFNSPTRLKYPLVRKNGKLTPVEWGEALHLVSDRLRSQSPAQTAFLLDPSLSNEAVFLFKKLAAEEKAGGRLGLLGNPFEHKLISLLRDGKTGLTLAGFREVEDSDTILVIGSDLYLELPQVTTSITRAQRKGARMALLDSNPANQLGLKAELALVPVPGGELMVLAQLVKLLLEKGDYSAKPKDLEGVDALAQRLDQLDHYGLEESGVSVEKLEELHALVSKADKLTIMVGAARGAFAGREANLLALVQELLLLTDNPGGLSLVITGGNALGASLTAGPGLLDAGELLASDPKFLYLTAPVPEEQLEGTEFLVVQGPYPFHHDRADVVLPSTVFAEESGSVVSGEGFVHSLNKAARPPALARPDWEILAMLGKTMHSPAFDYDGLEKLQRELMKQTKLKPGSLWRPAGRKKPALLLPELDSLGSAAEPSGPQFPAFSYRGASLEAEITDFASLAAGLRRRWSDE